MKRVHMESRAGNRGRKMFRSTSARSVMSASGLFSAAVAMILAKARR